MDLTHRLPRILHCTSEPYQFFGRQNELTLLDEALVDDRLAVVAFVGPGGQGKTAILQTWLKGVENIKPRPSGVFLWSFYRGKDADLCLRELFAYAEGLDQLPDISASYCVDRLLPRLQQEKWAICLDGTEVVQYETGPWLGRFTHPELSRLVEELASQGMPGAIVLTTRFALPTLEKRTYAKIVSLNHMDPPSAVGLLRSLGVEGDDGQLIAMAELAGYHAKAVELFATLIVHFYQKQASQASRLIQTKGSDLEETVHRIIQCFQLCLEAEQQDVLALATAFRQPPTEMRLLEFLSSKPVHDILKNKWHRTYQSFLERGNHWLNEQLDSLVQLRLLERVHSGSSEGEGKVIDAHPLVRRGFAHSLDSASQQENAEARAGFLMGRPDRRAPRSLAEAQEEIELFHAYCDAELWNEADSVYMALDNPKHRFLAPQVERDLLLRFFPDGDWARPPLWRGFGRYRSLAICQEMSGDFTSALTTYRNEDAPLRGDALLATGKLGPMLSIHHVAQPWQTLWQCYRCHALALAGKEEAALSLARATIPIDIYEWVHLFECLLRIQKIDLLDGNALRHSSQTEHRWAQLARQRIFLDYRRLTDPEANLIREYEELLEEYDRSGLPLERGLTRISFARYLIAQEDKDRSWKLCQVAKDLAERHDLRILMVDVYDTMAQLGDDQARSQAVNTRQDLGYLVPTRS